MRWAINGGLLFSVWQSMDYVQKTSAIFTRATEAKKFGQIMKNLKAVRKEKKQSQGAYIPCLFMMLMDLLVGI